MNPDSFIPFYGNDFNQAVEGQPDYIAMGYWRAIWYYWHVTHCRGLKDDQEFLRRLIRVDKDQWKAASEFIFDNEKQFTLDGNGVWHQGRAAVEWVKSKEKYEMLSKRGTDGNKKRWKGHVRKWPAKRKGVDENR